MPTADERQIYLAEVLKHQPVTFTVNPYTTMETNKIPDYDLGSIVNLLNNNSPLRNPLFNKLGMTVKMTKTPYEKNNVQVVFKNLKSEMIPIGLCNGQRAELFINWQDKEFDKVEKIVKTTYEKRLELKDKFNGRKLTRSKILYIFSDGTACTQGSLAKTFGVNDALTVLRNLDRLIDKLTYEFSDNKHENEFLTYVASALGKQKAPENINQALDDKEFKKALDKLSKEANWEAQDYNKMYQRATKNNIFKILGKKGTLPRESTALKKKIKERFDKAIEQDVDLDKDYTKDFNEVFKDLVISFTKENAPQTTRLLGLVITYLGSEGGSRSDYLAGCLMKACNGKVVISNGLDVLVEKTVKAIQKVALNPERATQEIRHIAKQAKEEY